MKPSIPPRCSAPTPFTNKSAKMKAPRTLLILALLLAGSLCAPAQTVVTAPEAPFEFAPLEMFVFPAKDFPVRHERMENILDELHRFPSRFLIQRVHCELFRDPAEFSPEVRPPQIFPFRAESLYNAFFDFRKTRPHVFQLLLRRYVVFHFDPPDKRTSVPKFPQIKSLRIPDNGNDFAFQPLRNGSDQLLRMNVKTGLSFSRALPVNRPSGCGKEFPPFLVEHFAVSVRVKADKRRTSAKAILVIIQGAFDLERHIMEFFPVFKRSKHVLFSFSLCCQSMICSKLGRAGKWAMPV